jgi:hypothetical protein
VNEASPGCVRSIREVLWTKLVRDACNLRFTLRTIDGRIGGRIDNYVRPVLPNRFGHGICHAYIKLGAPHGHDFGVCWWCSQQRAAYLSLRPGYEHLHGKHSAERKGAA